MADSVSKVYSMSLEGSESTDSGGSFSQSSSTTNSGDPRGLVRLELIPAAEITSVGGDGVGSILAAGTNPIKGDAVIAVITVTVTSSESVPVSPRETDADFGMISTVDQSLVAEAGLPT